MNKNQHHRAQLAFTLIEMLVVITIMAILAALVVTAGQAASQKRKIAAVSAEKARLMTMINSYYAKLNYYPLDNGNLASTPAPTPTVPGLYDALAATNPLIYELIGATNTNSNGKALSASIFVFNTINNNTRLLASGYSNVFNRGGVANADAEEPHNFFIPGPSPKEIGVYNNMYDVPICGLLVPVEFTNVQIPNFWHYDSSSTNRHNMGSYDLWAEYSIGSKNGKPILVTNGNW